MAGAEPGAAVRLRSSGQPVSDEQRQDWALLMQLRDSALLQLDRLKKETGLNKASEAEIVYHIADVRLLERLEAWGVDLEDLVGVGSHSFATGVAAGAAPAVSLVDRRSSFAACARCWKRRADVGQTAEFPDLCSRDAAVVHQAE